MREFCLIPRLVAEKYIFKKTNEDLSPPPHPPPPPPANIKTTPLPTSANKVNDVVDGNQSGKVKVERGNKTVNKMHVVGGFRPGKVKVKRGKKISNKHLGKVRPVLRRVNPSLNHFIPLNFKTARHREYASALLNYFQNNKQVVWDERGQLLSPISDLNLIDIISQLIQNQKYINTDKLPSIKMLLDHVRFPKDFIENKKARQQLYGMEWEAY